jgi:hypothetical protein
VFTFPFGVDPVIQAKILFKPVGVALATATLATAAWAAPVVHIETGTGDLPGTAEIAAPSGFGELRIEGTFLDASGGLSPNLVDLYGFSITNSGRYFFNTLGSGVADTQLFLFDSAGMGLAWNNDASVTPVATWSALDATLGVGNYFIAVTWFGMDPVDDAGLSIFDTLGNAGGPIAGTGALSGWADFSGVTLFDRGDYVITGYLPTPSALALALAALGLMAGVSTRRPRAA